uniref:ribosomal protein S14 n=1 Tax=Polymyxa betae TaxID=41456 RepID=UPI001D128B29|nr:ribosomal protein S14 [Polymyxa betae]CAG9644857.1 ribosomal protein S14 [Polymyxa betae]
MSNYFLKDYKKRLQFQNFEVQQKILRSLIFNCSLSPYIRRKLSWQYTRLCFLTSFSFVKNTCIFSGRSRSVYSFFNLSRLCIKDFFKAKILPNLIKSHW